METFWNQGILGRPLSSVDESTLQGLPGPDMIFGANCQGATGKCWPLSQRPGEGRFGGCLAVWDYLR